MPVAALGLGSALAYHWPLKFTALSVVPYAFSRRRAATRGARSAAVFRAAIAVALVDVLLLLLSSRLV